MRTISLGVTLAAACVLLPAGQATAGQPKTPQAAKAAAKALSACSYCDFDVLSRRPAQSAARGLVTLGVGDPQGGGAQMIMGYTGSSWKVLWEGNGSTRNVSELPNRIAVCMDSGGWTNLRRGPGLNYPRVGKIGAPTVTTAYGFRLESPVTPSREGVGWYRISYNGKPAWVQNLRTVGAYGGAQNSCRSWRYYR